MSVSSAYALQYVYSTLSNNADKRQNGSTKNDFSHTVTLLDIGENEFCEGILLFVFIAGCTVHCKSIHPPDDSQDFPL